MNRTDLRALANAEHEWALSMYMPRVADGTREAKQNALRQKHQLAAARQGLARHGLRESDARGIVEGLGARLEQEMRSTSAVAGIALWAWPDGVQGACVAQPFEELVTVGARFTLLPMLRLLDEHPVFYVVVVSGRGAQLFRGSAPSDWAELELSAESRAGVTAARERDERPEDLQLHSLRSLAGRAAIFHGQGGAEAVDDEHVRRFLRRVNADLMEVLREQDAPLVFAGDPSLLGLYRQENTYDFLCDDPVRGGPVELERMDLYARGAEIAGEALRRRRQTEQDFLNEAIAAGRGQTDLAPAIHAAAAGRVDTLAVAAQTPVWGHIRAGSAQVQVLPERTADSEELCNAAAVFTLRHGGRVLTRQREELPADGPVVAVLRY